MHNTKSIVSIEHCVISINKPFAKTCARFESRLGNLDYPKFKKLLEEKNPAAAIALVKVAEGPLGLMIFNVSDHGALLSLANQNGEAKQYVVGNPLFALQMTSQDIRAGLYAPLRVYVRGIGKDQSIIEYDLPSSLFGQFNNAEVDKVARMLDQRLAAAIEYVTSG